MTITSLAPLPNAESLLVHFRRIEQLKKESVNMPSIQLGYDALSDIELMLNRGFFPLHGFMGKSDYESVLDTMRLSTGEFWPVPITLRVPAKLGASLSPDKQLAVRDPEGFMLAVLTVEDVWEPDLAREAKAVYGTDDPTLHPEVAKLLASNGSLYVGGQLEGINMPQHYDFMDMRYSPSELHRIFSERGWTKIIGYQNHDPLHRMHKEMLLSAAVEAGAKLLLSPLIKPSFSTEVGHFSLVRCYQHFVNHLPRNGAMLHITPMRCRGAGPRGALLQALINRNYGCTHFLVNEHQDEPLERSTPFYPAKAAFTAIEEHKEILDIEPLLARPRVYVEDFNMFILPEEVKEGVTPLDISNGDLRGKLDSGEPLPDWFTFPEIIEELCRSTPPRTRQGFTLFLTGLSGAGKSTVAKVLYVKLQELQDRPVTLLDGDIVRRNLSSELSFSKEHRNLNVTRIGFVASEITKNRGIAICAPIAPYEESRKNARDMVKKYGGFVEIYMSTPLEICQQRDRKGLYAKAKAGIVKGVTGIDDPYEIPVHAALSIDTTEITPSEATDIILQYLIKEGYLTARNKQGA